jgi:hypothetical protein
VLGVSRWARDFPCFMLSERIDPPVADCGTWTHDPEKWVPVFRKDHAQTMS